MGRTNLDFYFILLVAILVLLCLHMFAGVGN